ncbi:hypothetical protein SHKM778_35900 [Streptomyces sp. KM77-8]|uniref:ROK family protein n=1 Tax=Streptomyces haneummycinicus TaxID=3074435 RepID=A0AAT9HIU1_9ACTN
MLEETAEYLGAGLADLINLFQPERILVGGWAGLQLGARFLEGVRRHALAYALRRPAARVDIVLGRLGPDAVTVGAATLPLADFFARGGGAHRGLRQRHRRGGRRSGAPGTAHRGDPGRTGVRARCAATGSGAAPRYPGGRWSEGPLGGAAAPTRAAPAARLPAVEGRTSRTRRQRHPQGRGEPRDQPQTVRGRSPAASPEARC